MCRLLGYVAREPVTPAHLLGGTFAAFVEVSRLHGDGWGLAWYEGHDRLQEDKAPEPAHTSPAFSKLLATIATDALIGHVRWATPGFALCMENTHPFTRKQNAFAHNGAVAHNEAIE